MVVDPSKANYCRWIDGSFYSNSKTLVKALCACVKEDETELSYEPGAVITGVRPAVWLTNRRWLEGTLNRRVGLVYKKDVEYLRDSPE